MSLHMHHVGVAVADVAEKAAFYCTLGYTIETPVIHDVTQQAYVQFLRFPGDRVYLELVQPDGPSSKLTRAVEKGGGLNHVCYSTDDIDEACATLRRRGLMIIAAPVPAVAFNGRRIAWLIGRDKLLTELVERGADAEL